MRDWRKELDECETAEALYDLGLQMVIQLALCSPNMPSKLLSGLCGVLDCNEPNTHNGYCVEHKDN